jgi:glycosidase
VTGRSWWREAVVYQIYPRSFMDASGDGVGDLAGIVERLDHVKDLGADAMWLSPFYPSPMADFGYDVSDYTGVDPLFGTLDDFDRVMDKARRLDLKVIVDLVPNHTSDQHPWFIESRSSRDAARRDWYVWADGPEPPNNWLSVFGGSAWEWDEQTGQYYLHSFLKEQPDLNWRNPAVEEAMLGVMRWWLDRGVDGFRIDVAHFMMKDPDLRDNPVIESTEVDHDFKDLGEYDLQEHLHDKGHPDVHRIFRSMRRVLDEYTPERVSLGEIHVWDIDEWASYYGSGDELHMPFNFSLLYPHWDASTIRDIVDRYDAVCVGDRWPNWVIGNHDEERVATRFGASAARAAAVLLLTLRGTPTIYYGDEIGMPETPVPPDRRVDPWGLRVEGLGRDGCRTPMQWDASPGAGFTSGEPWLPMGVDAATRNVATQVDDPSSMWSLYRSLLSYRRSRGALRSGDYRSFDAGDGVFGYHRTIQGEPAVTVVVAFNTPRMAEVGPGRIVISSAGDRIGEVVDGTIGLAADEAVVIEALV